MGKLLYFQYLAEIIVGSYSPERPASENEFMGPRRFERRSQDLPAVRRLKSKRIFGRNRTALFFLDSLVLQ